MPIHKLPIIGLPVFHIDKIRDIKTLGMYVAVKRLMHDDEVCDGTLPVIMNQFGISRKTVLKQLQVLVDLEILKKGN